jgi:hypothetical protein
MAEEANAQRSTPNAQRPISKANTERRTSNIERTTAEVENAQRSTPNAQRPMEDSVISLYVLFCRANAREEDHDEFFGFVKDGRHLWRREHSGFFHKP